MTTTDAGVTPLVTQLGRARASVMDVPVVLASLCSMMPATLGVAGAVILMTEPAQGGRPPAASDPRAARIGEVQQRVGGGPLVDVLRSGRPVYISDLRRTGPPALAAAAAETGFVSSLVLPVEVDGDQVGVLQLMGDPYRHVEGALGGILRPLLEVLAARLGDYTALKLARAASLPLPVAPENPALARTVASVDQAIPAPRVSQSGPVPPPDRAAAAAPTGRRSRWRGGGAHSTGAAGADSLSSTTSALPAVPAPNGRPHPNPAPAVQPDLRKPSTARPQADRQRSGRHSA